MVLSFFRSTGGEGDFDHIVTKAVSMLSDARHSFDLATLVLLTDADPATVSDDVNSTDDRINHAEQELRSELVVHVAVQGTADIGSVLGFTLLLKKIECSMEKSHCLPQRRQIKPKPLYSYPSDSALALSSAIRSAYSS